MSCTVAKGMSLRDAAALIPEESAVNLPPSRAPRAERS